MNTTTLKKVVGTLKANWFEQVYDDIVPTGEEVILEVSRYQLTQEQAHEEADRIRRILQRKGNKYLADISRCNWLFEDENFSVCDWEPPLVKLEASVCVFDDTYDGD